MEFDRESLLKTGEFAKLLKTTRATLIHYDNLGILKPAYTSDNGYRYYLPEQAQKFLLIELFTACGIGLKSLKPYFDTLELSQGKQLVQQSLDAVNDQIEKLTHIKLLMERKRYLYELALQHENELPFLIRFQHRTYMESSVFDSSSNWYAIQTDHSIGICSYYAENEIFPEFPFCSRMKIKYSEDEIALFPIETIDTEVLFEEMPEGMYVCTIKKGVRYSRDEVVAEMIEYAKQHNYLPSSDLYILDTVNFVVTDNEEDYSALYKIHVKEAGVN